MKQDGSFWNFLGGGSVFISHSHNDLDKVRRIRNSLEERGFDPLCFYLQCLTDDDEVEGLLKREIDAREWFAFMESRHSMESAWVAKEREYIQSRGGKKILYYRLQDCSPDEIAGQIIDNMTVYVCYSERDREYGRFVSESLSSMDFRVFDRCDSEANGDDVFSERYLEQTKNAIREAAEHGCFLFLVTDYSRQALMMRKELEYAVSYNAAVAAAFLDGAERKLSNDLTYLLLNADCEVIHGSVYEGTEQIASLVGQTLLRKAGNTE